VRLNLLARQSDRIVGTDVSGSKCFSFKGFEPCAAGVSFIAAEYADTACENK